MSIWEKYSEEQRKEYIKFLQVYGALSNLFRQKQGDFIPYLDSKFQETIFAKIFKSQNVDIGNTPHDVLSVFGDERIGIGLKTWMSSKPSFQKVMQLKRYQNDINEYKDNLEDLAHKISEIKNEKMKSDYIRLGLSENRNIYHYVTRDEGKFTINECAYPLIDTHNLKGFSSTITAFSWTDGQKDYKYTFGDSQIWQKFDTGSPNALLLHQFDVSIIEDPFNFLLEAYSNIAVQPEIDTDIVEVYLPLYSYQSKEVEQKSGLNAWNAAPKSVDNPILRPLNEVYITIPRDFHYKHPDFFTDNIFDFENYRKAYQGDKIDKPEIRFHLNLPNGKRIPALVTQDNMKSLQSGSNTEYDEETGKRYGQSALGQWLLVDVLGLRERQLVTRDWLIKKGTDSVRLWRKKGDYQNINIDFAPVGAFEAFIKNMPVDQGEDEILI